MLGTRFTREYVLHTGGLGTTAASGGIDGNTTRHVAFSSSTGAEAGVVGTVVAVLIVVVVSLLKLRGVNFIVNFATTLAAISLVSLAVFIHALQNETAACCTPILGFVVGTPFYTPFYM